MRAPSPQTTTTQYHHSSYTSPYQTYDLAFYTAPPQGELTPAQKRQKLEQDFAAGFPPDDEGYPFISQLHSYPTTTMPIRNIPLNPHINLQRASEPASPITIATSLSTHSTPASSPSRVTIMSAHGSPADFQLYDECYDRKRRNIQNFENTSTQSRFGNGYDSSMTQPLEFFDHQPRHYLQAPPSQQQFGSQGLVNSRAVMHSDDDELPALSPHHRGQFSSRLSASDVDLHSPTTPIASPESVCGDGVQVAREDACQYIESWIDHYLLSDSELHHPIPGPPKLDRTVSDAIQDELYNPGVAPGTEHATRPSSPCTTPSKVAFLYQQAQNQHAITTSPIVRDHSPFRANSPYAHFPVVTRSPQRTTTLIPAGFATARAQREKLIAVEREVLKKQMEEDYHNIDLVDHPCTISPKDAYREYHESSQEGIKGPLFASQEDVYSQNGSIQSGSYKGSVQGDEEDDQIYNLKREETQESYASMATSRRESDASMNFNATMFPANQQFTPLGFPYSNYADGSDHKPQMAEDEGEYGYQSAGSPLTKPAESKANRGGYTCTVPGCNQRFPTTNKMAKHRREAHRQTSPGSRGDGIARSHHPGPHKCNRLNPTTNKPCNTIFSRPYDLTRHEDTIHNTHREKVRCEICNDEKTFSRQDALTRHKKVNFPLN